jgi:hypothetical protein
MPDLINYFVFCCSVLQRDVRGDLSSSLARLARRRSGEVGEATHDGPESSHSGAESVRESSGCGPKSSGTGADSEESLGQAD